MHTKVITNNLKLIVQHKLQLVNYVTYVSLVNLITCVSQDGWATGTAKAVALNGYSMVKH